MIITQIDEFFVTKLIAQGGQAKIYQANNQKYHVAIKVYDFYDEKSHLQFIQEKQLMTTIQHKSILSPFDYRVGATIVLQNLDKIQKNIVIMKYLKNGDLMDQIIRNGRVQSKTILYIVRQLVECLMFLSRKEVFHGDLKAQNLLLDSSFKPLLIDFGFFSRKNDRVTNSFPKQNYMAPQVTKGLQYTQKSQAFSLGVLIFVCAMGCAPFKATKHTDLGYRALLQGKHNIFWKIFQQKSNIKLEQNLKTVIVNLIEPNPKRRWSYQNLLQSDWFNEQMPQQKQYVAYFKERNRNKINNQQCPYELPCTDNEQKKSQSIQIEDS